MANTSWLVRRIALVASLGTLACANAVNQECTREQQCGDGPAHQSAAQCETDWNNCIAQPGTGDACKALTDALQSYASCVQGLSCADRAGNLSVGPCSNELTTYWNAQKNAQGASCSTCPGVAPPDALTTNPGG